MSFRNLQFGVAVMAALATVVPAQVFAATPATGNDVSLAAGGMLVGQIVDAQGSPVKGETIDVMFQGAKVATMKSDTNGVFAAKGLKGGEYLLATKEGAANVRVWTEGTAPPTAQKGVTVVAGEEGTIVRGQRGGPMNFLRRYPWTTATVIGTAIAVPIIVEAADDDDAPTS